MMNIKKRQIISGILAAAMLSVGTGVFAEAADAISEEQQISILYGEATYTKLAVTGTVKGIEEGQIAIEAENGELVINTDENTVFATADGIGADISEIKESSIVKVIADEAETKSLPPQRYGYTVIIGDEEAVFPTYIEVSGIETDENGNTLLLSADGLYTAVASEETRVVPFKTKQIADISDINKGSKLFVYSDIMTMSIPAVLPSSKIVIVEQGKENELTETEKVIVNGEEIAVKIEEKDGISFLPVRAIGEKLGLEVEWNDGLRAVRVGTVQMGVTFNIGNNSYTKAKMKAEQLSAAPELINEKSYLPMDFYTEMLEGKAEVNENGVLSLSF